MSELKFKEVIVNPQDYFTHPNEVLDCDNFDLDEKRRILQCWEHDLRLMQTCDEENMPCSIDTAMLSRIHQALVKLQ